MAAAAAAPGLLPLPPPGPLPPPATDDGYLELLGVLRLRARGLPAWMLPPYIHFDVDVYGFQPQELLDTYPSATAADGSSAVFFVNQVRANTANRSRRSVPGGSWMSDRAPVPLVSGSIQGNRQTFSFKVDGKRLRDGFLMQELRLAGEEGALQGGDQLVLSKIYLTPPGDKIGAGVASSNKKTRTIGAGPPAQQAVASSNAASACFPSSAPALRLGSCYPAHRVPSPAPPLLLGASTSSAPPLRPGASTSSAPPLRRLGASTSSAPPLGATIGGLSGMPRPRSAASTSSASTSSTLPLGKGATSTSSSPGRRLLLLEVADFPPVGEDFLPMRIYRASERVGGRVVLVDCDDLFLLQKKKMQATDISFTYKELNAATLGFTRDHFLGEGIFGKVYKGVLTGDEVAIKILNPHGSQGNKEFCTEVMVLSRMNHPNLVKFVGFCADDDQRLLVYEFMPLGSLETHIFDLAPDKKPLDWNTRLKILVGAAQGLEHLHVNCNPPVINGDVKCANILLGEGYHPKLADYGLAKLGPTGEGTHVSTRVMGTPGYCAPEYLESGQLTIKSDVYSFGVVILEVITGRKALDQSRIRAESSLVEWAANLIVRKEFGILVDPTLINQYSMTELYRVLTVARMCLKRTAGERPEITDVAAALAYISTPSRTRSATQELPTRERCIGGGHFCV